ncbi:MAG: histidine kinase [Alistipes sp.]|jgi:signal transduction histidine kinase|nr:histidine kinase [Alistipes sp.]
MAVKILLIVSILLQLAATGIAIGLVRKTKFNSVWILLIVALVLMTVSRVLQFVHFIPRGTLSGWLIALTWFDIAISLALTVVMFYARRLVEYIDGLIVQNGLTAKRILSTILRTEEKERSRFARELHDGLGPLLSSAKMSLSALSTEGRSEGDRQIITNTTHVVDEAIGSLREISNNLSPHVLGEFGLGKGVANFVNRLSGIHPSTTINFRTDLRGERFDTDVEVILYRVICELVSNSLRHSGASEVTLSLDYDGAGLSLDYGDNGRGFNPAADDSSGMGLANISSRINTLGGTLEMESAPGRGMRARVRIVLTRRSGHDKGRHEA